MAVQQYGTVAALFDTALLNEASVTDDLVPGGEWLLPEVEYERTAVQLAVRAAATQALVMPRHVTLADVAQQVNGSVAAWFELALLNGLSITDDVTPGTLLQAANTVVAPTEVQALVPVPKPELLQLKKQQTLADWTTQHFGAFEALFEMAQLNGLSVTEEPEPGTVLQRMITDAAVVTYFARNNVDVVSYKTAAAVQPGGIGFMQIANDFIVS